MVWSMTTCAAPATMIQSNYIQVFVIVYHLPELPSSVGFILSLEIFRRQVEFSALAYLDVDVESALSLPGSFSKLTRD